MWLLLIILGYIILVGLIWGSLWLIIIYFFNDDDNKNKKITKNGKEKEIHNSPD